MEKITKLSQLPLKILLFIVVNDILDTTAQLLMKKGVHHLFNFANHDAYMFWIGLAIYASNFFLWMIILSKVDLSVAIPLASSSYILIPIGAIFFLHEYVTPVRWLSLILIILGIFFISKSKPSRSMP